MRVTAIRQQQKNTERVSIFVDGKYSFSLSVNDLIAEKLKIGFELDGTELARLVKKSNDQKIRMRCLEWVVLRPHSIQEFRDYLKRKKVEADFLDRLTEEFIKKGYLDDQKFSNWWHDRGVLKQKSNRAIRFELQRKGVQKEIISGLFDRGLSIERERLEQLIAKLQTKERYQDRRRLVAYLSGRGYDYSLIKEVLNEG